MCTRLSLSPDPPPGGESGHYLKRIRNESTRTPITGVFIQDHRLPRAQRERIASMAKGLNLLAITSHSPPHPHNRICYGGTMIVIPYEAIELEEKETIHAACERIKRTQKRAGSGRYTSLEMTVNGQKRKLTSAYAPATPADHPGFFCAIGGGC